MTVKPKFKISDYVRSVCPGDKGKVFLVKKAYQKSPIYFPNEWYSYDILDTETGELIIGAPEPPLRLVLDRLASREWWESISE